MRMAAGVVLAWIFIVGGGLAGEEPAGEVPSMSPRQRIYADLVDETMLSHWDTDRGLESLVTLPTGEGNAAEYYAKLEALYAKGREQDKITVSPQSQGVQEILAASKIRSCQLTPNYYPAMESGTSNQPDIVVFQAYANALLEYARDLSKEDGKTRAAVEAYQAALIFGWHLTGERPNLVTFMLGITIKLKATRAYGRYLQRLLYLEQAHAADVYVRQLSEVLRRLMAKTQVYLGDFENFNCLYATIKIAKEDKDYLWRQEAVLRLGVLRHGAPDRTMKNIVKDKNLQRLATDTLMQVAENDPQPWIRKLAQWSIQNVTPERFQEMRKKVLLRSLQEEKTDDAPLVPAPGESGKAPGQEALPGAGE